MNDIQKELEQLKVGREVDEHNESHEFRLGYVKAMCHAINLVKNLDIPRVIDCSTCKHQKVSKYVEPCYGCRDNDSYDHYESDIGL